MSQGMRRYASMTSVHSMASLGYLPPGHGYIPRKQKPDKPYGPDFITIMNRTWRGPGKTYLIYALVAFCLALLFYGSTALYFGHRNVSRLMVLRTEVFGAIFLIIAVLLTGLTFHFIWKARNASNDWRNYTKFRAEGLFTAAAYNHAYVPEDGTKLATGTYGPRALKEIPRPKPKGRSRRGSQSSGRNVPASAPTSSAPTTERRYEKKSEAQAPKGSQGNLPPPQAPSGSQSEPPPPRGSMEYLGPGATIPVSPAPYQQEQIGYQPPPPDDFSHLYAQPARRQRKPAPDYPGVQTSVPVLSPMPASPIGQAAPRYSMEDVRPVPTRSAPVIPVHGMPYGGTSESEL